MTSAPEAGDRQPPPRRTFLKGFILFLHPHDFLLLLGLPLNAFSDAFGARNRAFVDTKSAISAAQI